MHVVKYRLLVHLCSKVLHLKSLLLGGTYVHAVAAAGAVHGRYLHGEAVCLECGDTLGALDCLGSLGQFLLGGEERTDGGVRADVCALVALDTFLRVPLGNAYCDASLFESGCTGRNGTVGILTGESTYRHVIAVLGVDHIGHAAYPLGSKTVEVGGTETGYDSVPLCRSSQFLILGSAVHCGVVHADHLLSLLAVALVDGFLHEGHCLLVRDDAGNLEERRLEDGVGTVAQTYLLGYLGSVDDIYLQVLLSDNLLYMIRDSLDGLLYRPEAVEEECTAPLDTLENIVLVQV